MAIKEKTPNIKSLRIRLRRARDPKELLYLLRFMGEKSLQRCLPVFDQICHRNLMTELKDVIKSTKVLRHLFVLDL